MKHTDVQLTSMESFEGFHIEHKELVYSNVVLGANFVKDAFARMTDTFGGRSSSYSKTCDEGCKIALEELQRKAMKIGANAVVRVDFEFNAMGKNGTILSVHAHGNAVLLTDEDTYKANH